MTKGCKFKEHIAGMDKDGNKVIIFQKDETYVIIGETEEGVDDSGFEHAPAYFFPNGLGIEKKFENKLYEVVEV